MVRTPRRDKKPKRPARSKAARQAVSTVLWRRIVQRIEADIASGRLTEGARLPAETTMASELGVNRHTLRRAIADLVERGVLRSVAHGGAFVAPSRISIELMSEGPFSAAIANPGISPSLRLVSQSVGPPPAEVARQLRIAQRTPVVAIVHVRMANERPLCLVDSWSPADRFARLGELFAATGCFRRAFAQCGVPRFRRTRIRVLGRLANEVERGVLGLPRGAQVIQLETLSVDWSGEPIEVAVYRFGAERVEIAASLAA